MAKLDYQKDFMWVNLAGSDFECAFIKPSEIEAITKILYKDSIPENLPGYVKDDLIDSLKNNYKSRQFDPSVTCIALKSGKQVYTTWSTEDIMDILGRDFDIDNNY